MENRDISEGESTLSLLAICIGLIMFLWSIFSIFYTFIQNRTRRLILRAVAWWIILIAEISAIVLLYDRVLDPLEDGSYRWNKLPYALLFLGIIYVAIAIFGMWDDAKLNKQEQFDN